jgi:hypothetical protein
MIIAACTCVVAATLSAQDAPRTALMVGTGSRGGLGVLVPISNSVALRASASGSLSSSGGTDAWTAGVGLGGVFYLNTANALKPYVGPGIGFTYSRFSPTGAATKTPSGGVVFGGEYAISRQFGVFGEVGLSYARTTGTSRGPGNSIIDVIPSNFWSTTNGIGFLFHF